jgi:hypothetical protein
VAHSYEGAEQGRDIHRVDDGDGAVGDRDAGWGWGRVLGAEDGCGDVGMEGRRGLPEWTALLDDALILHMWEDGLRVRAVVGIAGFRFGVMQRDDCWVCGGRWWVEVGDYRAVDVDQGHMEEGGDTVRNVCKAEEDIHSRVNVLGAGSQSTGMGWAVQLGKEASRKVNVGADIRDMEGLAEGHV